MFFKKIQPSGNTFSSTSSVTKDDEQQLEDWLKYLYRESWQQELLITGITLFLLFQVPDSLTYLEAKLFQYFYSNDLIIAAAIIMFGIFKISANILIFNILIDIFLRGLWIGLIGLSSAFPEGVQKSRFKYHPILETRILDKITDPKKTIIKLDIICSIIFSFTFLIIFYLFSFGLFIVYILLMVLGIQYFDGTWISGVFIGLIVIFCSLGCIYFLDFITFGGLRRFKLTAKPYYFIYKIFNYITLSFFYKNIYYTLISNVKKRYIFPVLSAYFLFVVLISDGNNGSTKRGEAKVVTTVFYDDLRAENELIKVASIPSDVVKGNWLKVFTRFDINRKTIKHFVPEYMEEDREILNTRPTITRQIFEDMLTAYTIRIDNQEIDSLDWLFQAHPNMGEKGFVTRVNLKDFSEGLHQLQIIYPRLNKNDSLEYKVSCTIPFWKE